MRRKVTVSELTEAYSAGRDAARSAPPAWPIICKKKGGETFLFIGSVNRRSKDIFRERIAQYINDDPLLSKQILRSNTNRSKTVLMLKDYNPSK